MRRILRFFAVLVALAVAAPASAQVQTGSILVRATDEQGARVPGVTVTISSPVLVAGSMTGVTDAGGVYRFPSLVPGTYAVKLELSGFQTINRESIVVLVGQTTPVDFSMKVASLAENITVTGASPTVDTTSANVNVNLSEQLIQGTPGGRDIWALVEAKVPGLVISRPDVGGTSGGLQGTFSARGTDQRAEHVVPERRQRRRPGGDRRRGLLLRLRRVRRHPGVDRRARHHRADLRRVPEHDHEDRRQQVERQHHVHLDRRLAAGAQRHRSGRCRSTASGPNGNTSDFVSDINVTAGGPLVQNKLRFFGSFRDWRVHQNVPVQNSQIGARPDQHHVRPGQRHVAGQSEQPVTGFYSRQRYSKPNRLLNNASITVIDSTVRRTRHVRPRPGPVELGPRQELLRRRPPRAEQDSVPDLLQNGGNQQSVTDNATGIVYGNIPTDIDPQPRSLSGQRDRPVLRRSGARRPARVPVRLRLLARGHQERERTASTTCGTFYNSTSDAAPQNVDDLRDAADRRVGARTSLALFAQDSYSVQAADAHRRPALGAARRLPAGAVQPAAQFAVAISATSRRSAQLRRGARRRAVAHGGPARQRDLRRHRRRQDRRQGVGRPLLLRAVDRRRRRQQRQPERQLLQRPTRGTTSTAI